MPAEKGIRVIVADRFGAVVLDRLVQPGAFKRSTKTGWLRDKTKPAIRWTYTRPLPATAAGVSFVEQLFQVEPDVHDVQVVGNWLPKAISSDRYPLTATVMFEPIDNKKIPCCSQIIQESNCSGDLVATPLVCGAP